MDPLIDLALLLFGAKVGGIVFSKLKQPSIVGELIAGILLGPALLGIVKTSSLIEAVSHLGLLFLILLVSISIDWKMLGGNVEKFVLIELTRIAVTIGLVYIIATTMALDPATFIILSLVIILSSTAIASRTLADLKELDSHEGQIIMGLEIVDEIVAIMSIAILANIMAEGTVRIEPLLTTVFLVVGIFVVMNHTGLKLVSRVTSSIQKYGIEEALLAFTLLLAFILGGIAESLKLASVLGVFIAGMLLSKSAQSQIITKKVKEIGESFFIPLFFASVGLSLNLFLAVEQINLIVVLVLATMAIKIVACFIAARAFHYTNSESFRISIGFNTLSEMTVVLVALAVTKLDPAFYVAILASFVIVNTISPVIMNLVFRFKREAKMSDTLMGRLAEKVKHPVKKKSEGYTFKPGK